MSLPTIQRMEKSHGNVRGIVDTLTKVVAAFDLAGVELISEDAPNTGIGRGVRFRTGADRPSRVSRRQSRSDPR